jgi:putative flippase GtrA
MTVLRAELGRLSRYGLAGLSTNGLLYLAFLSLIALRVHPVLASGLCYVAGVSLSYLVNRRWTFASRSSHSRDLPRFIASYGVGFLVTLLSTTVLIRFLSPSIAQLLTIGITAMSIYLSLRVLRFGEHG